MDFAWIIAGIGFLIFFVAAFGGNRAGLQLAKTKIDEAEKHCTDMKSQTEHYCEEQKRKTEKHCEELRKNTEHYVETEKYKIGTERHKISAERAKLEQDRIAFQAIMRETSQSHPELSRMIADAEYHLDLGVAVALTRKKCPAFKASEDVKAIAAEKRQLLKERKILEYQLHFFETLFPWLEEFKEITIQEAISYAKQSGDNDYDAVRNWLSPEEYQKLTNAEKFQLALNRWKERKKTAWDIGVEFERYIGYLLEIHGYQVKYVGAIMGVEDMGRDLMATKNDVSLIIQCKRWAKEKTIHEKHICQLYGSVAVLASQHPDKKYKGVFITTTQLSDTARDFARYSRISVVENCVFLAHPLIKCNISKNGEKIYHLPFDQQYDRTEIAGKPGAFYAWTVKEAEAKGFRRAYKWHPDS